MEKYSKRIIIIHWLTLVLLVAAWFLGDSLDDARHEGGATIAGYMVHSLVGGAVLLLALMRLAFRRTDGTPPPMGDTPMDKVAKGVHHFLYLLLIVLPLSGIMQVLTSNVGKSTSPVFVTHVNGIVVVELTRHEHMSAPHQGCL